MKLQELREQLWRAQTKTDLYSIAGVLNNMPEHIHSDKVTILAFCDFFEASALVLKMIQESESEA